VKLSPIPLLILTIALAQFAIAADRPRNIFDDDWQPPKTTEKPRPPATVIPPTPRLADPAKATTTKPPTPKSTPAIPDAPRPPQRVPVPSKPAQAAVRQVMKEVFAEQLADRSIPARRKLTAALMAQADKSSQVPTDRFVLLAAAIDAAIDAVNLPAALRAADRMAEAFDVDGLGVKADAALRLGPKSGVPDSAAENVNAVLELSKDLARADDYATAARVCAALQPAATRDPSLRAQLQQRQRELVIARDAADRFAKDLEKLKAFPDDPAANLAAGRYVCLVKGEWDAGLLMLAKGSDVTLKSLAARELTHATTADETAAAGDAWWDAAAKQLDPASRAAVTAHAVALYERSVNGIAGLRKVQIEKRIAEVAASRPSMAIELLPHMEGQTGGTDKGVVLLKRGDRIATVESFKAPVAFRMVVQTDSTDFRIAYAARQIIFNWETSESELRIDGGPASGHHKRGAGSVPKKTWVTIDLVVTADLMALSVDGELRHSVKADFSHVDEHLSILAHVSPLMVKSVQMSKPPPQ
jgi:hypothetical protein